MLHGVLVMKQDGSFTIDDTEVIGTRSSLLSLAPVDSHAVINLKRIVVEKKIFV